MAVAKRFFVAGRVQGVGYRYFAQRAAEVIKLSGYVRNLDDGGVEAYAVGTLEQLSEFESQLWRGPRWADVRSVEAREETIDGRLRGFHIR